MCKLIISRFVYCENDQVEVIFNQFVNVGKQEIINEVFLPMISHLDLRELQ